MENFKRDVINKAVDVSSEGTRRGLHDRFNVQQNETIPDKNWGKRFAYLGAWGFFKIALVITGIILICVYTMQILNNGEEVIKKGGDISKSYINYKHKILWGEGGTSGTMQYISNIIYYTLLASFIGIVLKKTYERNEDIIKDYIQNKVSDEIRNKIN